MFYPDAKIHISNLCSDTDITLEKVLLLLKRLSNARQQRYFSHDEGLLLVKGFNTLLAGKLNIEIIYVRDGNADGIYDIFDPKLHIFDICSQFYYRDSYNEFVTVHRRDPAKNFKANPSYMSVQMGFYCNIKRKYYYSEEFTRIIDAHTSYNICLEANESKLYQWSDGRYSIQKEPVNTTPLSTVRKISDYHCSPRPAWWKDKEGIGMELEMYGDHRDLFIEKFRRIFLLNMMVLSRPQTELN